MKVSEADVEVELPRGRRMGLMPWRRSGKQEQASPLKSKVQQDAALQTKLNEVRGLLYESGHEV